MKILIILLVNVFSAYAFSSGHAQFPNYMVSAGHGGAPCAIADKGILCNGTDDHYVDNAFFIHVADKMNLVLAGEQMICWPYYICPVAYNYKLKNPRLAGGVDGFACVLDDNGLRCWDTYPDSYLMPLKNPKSFSVGPTEACAIDDDGLHCWARPRQEKTPLLPPALKNPRKVSVGRDQVCAIDGGEVKCWGERKWHVPAFKNPRDIGVGNEQALNTNSRIKLKYRARGGGEVFISLSSHSGSWSLRNNPIKELISLYKPVLTLGFSGSLFPPS